MSVPHGHKFACAALIVRSVNLPPSGIEVGNGIVVLPTCPIPVEGFWEKWTGTAGVKPLREGNVFILATSPSKVPSVLDQELADLDQLVAGFRRALGLEGSNAIHDGVVALGGHDVQGIEVRQLIPLDPIVRPAYVLDSEIDESMLRSAAQTLSGLMSVYRYKEHVRIRRGFQAIGFGFKSQGGGERLHQFVRGVEAFLKPEQGRGKRHFSARGQVLAGPSAGPTLGELYDLRSQAEHLNDLKVQLVRPDMPDPEVLALFRSYQAERLAQSAYRRFFQSAELQAHFRTDADITAFWNLDREEQVRLWGEHIDLDGAATAKFYKRGAPGNP